MQEKPNNEETCPHCRHINGVQADEHYYLPEGTLLQNRYTVGRVLGHGGFGITYIGFDQKLEMVIAIKEYLPTEVASRSYGQVSVTTFSGDKKDQYDYGLTRFIDEAKSLARYNHHPCIVSTSDYFEENNTAYIVMEYLDGISLAEYLKRKGGKISWQETLEIMSPVMDALREVHSTGMIHRDISPDNIYITNKGLVKLLDFGAARFAMGEKSKSLSVILKPGYAPPEQYYTNGKQGPWTDIYSLASTMYKMLTGTTPPEAVERVMEDDIVSLKAHHVEIDNQAEAAILKALSVKSGERHQDVEVFREGLLKCKQSDKIYQLDEEDNDSSAISIYSDEVLLQTNQNISFINTLNLTNRVLLMLIIIWGISFGLNMLFYLNIISDGVFHGLAFVKSDPISFFYELGDYLFITSLMVVDYLLIAKNSLTQSKRLRLSVILAVIYVFNIYKLLVLSWFMVDPNIELILSVLVIVYVFIDKRILTVIVSICLKIYLIFIVKNMLSSLVVAAGKYNLDYIYANIGFTILLIGSFVFGYLVRKDMISSTEKKVLLGLISGITIIYIVYYVLYRGVIQQTQTISFFNGIGFLLLVLNSMYIVSQLIISIVSMIGKKEIHNRVV